MPNMNSGTERPYAPLLEPCIILRRDACTERLLSVHRSRCGLELNNTYTDLCYYTARMPVSLGR